MSFLINLLPWILSLVFVSILGLCLGSFVGAFVTRYVRSEKVTKGRSHCDFCNHLLSWRENIPLISWLVQKGKCRHCGHSLSAFYPGVELATALTFGSLYFYFFKTALPIFIAPVDFIRFVSFILALLISLTLIAIFFADLRDGIIPDVSLIWGVALTVIYKIWDAASGYWLLRSNLLDPANKLGKYLIQTGFLDFHLKNYYLIPLAWDLGGAILAVAFFLLLVLVTRGRGMGLGDVKFAFLMGLLCGWPKIAVAIMIAFVTGALVSLVLMLFKKKGLKSTIHFGPFLVLAIPIALLWSDFLLQLYFKIRPS
ncbi:MAG: prepilin peptidase [candidate division WWE3 bacterium]|nr:prepilin peptidase [candidate division WWE3 bacterium]